MDDEALLRDVARALYARPLGEFIAARKERAGQLADDGRAPAGRQVAGFKKPSAGADAVNRLIRADEPLADDIADLGRRLRAAQAASAAADLRALDQERRALVARARAAARELDASLTAATLDHVEQTVWAAVVDASAAGAVLAGTLVRPLSPGGFGEVDVDGASAVPVEPLVDDVPSRRRPARRSDGGPQQKKADERSRAKARREAEKALAAAQDAGREAQHRLEEASAAADEAIEARDALETERDELRTRLGEIEEALRDSKADITRRSADLRDAERRRRSAAADIDRAVARLDGL